MNCAIAYWHIAIPMKPNEAQRLMHLRVSMSQSNGADASALQRENYIEAQEGYTAHG